MPRKQAASDEPHDSERLTAPAVPKALSKQLSGDQTTPQPKVGTKPFVAPQAERPLPPMSASSSAEAIDNPETDKAVDDIMAEESDMVLAVDDIMAAKRSRSAPVPGWKDRLRNIVHNKWTWVGVGVVLCLLLAVPYTRYKMLGLFIKEKINVTVIDSQTDTPVSNAMISLGGANSKTDANGNVQLRATVGEQTLVVKKQYYRTSSTHYFVGFKHGLPPTVKLIATGRLVPITVLNTISGQPVSGAVIHVLKTTAKTNSKGEASVALPTGVLSDTATIDLTGYNTKHVSIQVTAQVLAGNSFDVTPAGSVYFLSNQNGSISVVRSNLDGSNLHVVLAGSGHETAATTRLLVSHDWHYLVLEANRDGTRPALYLINTSNDQVTEFDNSNSAFNPIGWYGHDFLYSLTSNIESPWQTGVQAIKDYDADQHQLNQLDQSQALGDSSSYAYQTLSNMSIAGYAVVYDTQWIAQGGYDLSNENDTIRAFQFVSQAKKDYESFPATTTGAIGATQYQPQAVYFEVPSSIAATTYYQYSNQSVQTATIDQATFNQSYPTYVVSPSGKHTLWSVLHNGQDLFFTGDSNAAGQRQIAALDNYVPYGWYSDSYILASRGNDQLYVLPANGLSGNQQPTKITDYYEPAKASGYEYSGL